MSALPPTLLYLTIYNPTLRPSQRTSEDDEDAEEQSQILFYTSRERAVSRDRILRQVGLAKALVNFSGMFNFEEGSSNVHSQLKRMIMVSPEPNFWIHAAVEVSRTPREAPEKGKLKGKDRNRQQDKTTAKEGELRFDYHESSVHDAALRADVLQGYEKFKLAYGSFASVLSRHGQEGLEVQLERFFTVWAWSWDLEDGFRFGEHLGVPLHPIYRTITDRLDELENSISSNVLSIVATTSHVIPSTRFGAAQMPASLPRHLMSLIPPSRPPESTQPSSTSSLPDKESPLPKRPPDPSGPDSGTTESRDSGSSTPFSMPSVNFNMKWNWPGYLSIKALSKKSPRADEASLPPEEPKQDQPPATQTENADVDQGALDNAISETISTSPQSNLTPESASNGTDGVDEPHTAGSANTSVEEEDPPVPPSPRPILSTSSVYIADPPEGANTRRRRIRYFIAQSTLLAIVNPGEEDSFEVETNAGGIGFLAESINETLQTAPLQSSSDMFPSATKILQAKDRHIFLARPFTSSNETPFASKSVHLFNAQQFLESDPSVEEVFSRGQNPQHWHVGRRLNGRDTSGEERLFMEVFRKEASLTDVDNALVGLTRTHDNR